MTKLLRTFILFILVCGAVALSQEPISPATAPVRPADIDLSAQAAAIRSPAMKYELVPPFGERTEGNAAQIYLMAFLRMNFTPGESDRLADLLAMPDEKFPLLRAKELLAGRQSLLEAFDLAARRDHCDWQIPVREKGYGTLLPHLSHCRNAASLLALQARVQIADGQFDDAIHTLQSGFALVMHLKSDAVLVQGMVSLAISNLMFDEVARFQQAAGAPNLYWTVANLPRPLVDLRAMVDEERSMLWHIAPELKMRPAAQFSEDDCRLFLTRFSNLSRMITGDASEGVRERLNQIAQLAITVGPARAWLADHGHDARQLKEMSIIRVVALYDIESYWEISDANYKWIPFPYWQQRDGLASANVELHRMHATLDSNPVLALMPSMSKICLHMAQMDRRIAFLQTVEALRAYAASHDGKFPASLADLSETPSPMDPMTGRAFDYEVAGATATLRSTGPKGNEEEAQVYHVKLRGGK